MHNIIFSCEQKVTTEEVLCNGHKDFCELPFNKFTFLGSHNSGTGQVTK